jgi:molybdate transport repressor ModE-like protein
MSSAATRSIRTPPTPPGLRWSWDFGPLLGHVDSRRLLALLTALAAEGALGNAARQAGMSYRSAWGLLRECELAFGAPLVFMQRGRGTRLTDFGDSLVRLDASARVALDAAHAPWQRRLQDLLAPVVRPTPERLRLAASHDLALADWIEHGRRIPFDLFWRGSEEALAELGRDECDIAGFHVPESWPLAQLENWLGLWLEASRHVCLPVMRRHQGLIVARGNPHRVQSIADVSRRRLRLVNRQRGSGTRSLIDQLLAAYGLRPVNIAGYHHEEFTHEAIAATIAAGQADVGFGIEAAAARYDLGFVPQVVERYGFAMARAIAASPEGKAFLARLQGNTFRQRLLAMPGYEPLTVREPGAWAAFLA